VGAPDRNCRIDRFKHQPRTVLNRATILICAFVTAILQELIEQVSVCPMELDSIESCAERVSAPRLYSATIPAISSSFSALGVTKGRCGRSKLTWPSAAIALGATGSPPFK
jgi:hypothetical protein